MFSKNDLIDNLKERHIGIGFEFKEAIQGIYWLKKENNITLP